MNNKPFVSNKISRLLKEKGFDLQCMACYDKLDMLSTYSESIFVTKNYNTSGYVCSAPLYQQVIDWFRNKYHIHIEIRTMASSNIHGLRKEGKEILYQYWIHDLREKYWNQGETVSEEYFDYYEALDRSIEEALKLI
jgi:hypothetical protein